MKRVALAVLGCLILAGCATVPPGEQPQIILTSPASKAKVFAALNGKFQTYGFTLDICTLEGGMLQTSWKDKTGAMDVLFTGDQSAVRFTVTISGDSTQTVFRGTGQSRSLVNMPMTGPSVSVFPLNLKGLTELQKIMTEAKVVAETP